MSAIPLDHGHFMRTYTFRENELSAPQQLTFANSFIFKIIYLFTLQPTLLLLSVPHHVSLPPIPFRREGIPLGVIFPTHIPPHTLW